MSATLANLTSAIAKMHNTARALDIVASGTIHQRGGFLVDMVKERCPELREYTVLVLTKDEAEAVSFMTLESGDRADELAKVFEAFCDEERPS